MLNLKDLKELIGKKISLYLFYAILIGILLFVVEYLFVYALQGFLITLGVSDTIKMELPAWLPKHESFYFFFFILIGTLRVIFMQLKIYLGRKTNQIFLSNIRATILSFSIRNASLVSSHETFGLFSDTLSRAGSVIVEGTSLIITVLSTILLLVAGFSKAPYEMLIGLGFLVLLLWPIKKLSRVSLLAGNSLSENWEKTTKILFEGMKHHYFFKAHDLVEDQVDKGMNQINEYEGNYNKYFIVTTIKNALPQIVGIMLIIFLSFLGKNYFHTSGPNLIAFLYIFLRVSQSGSEAFGTFGNIAFNMSSLTELKKWIDFSKNQHAHFHTAENSNLITVPGINSIEFNQVAFSYTSEKLLKDINFNLNKGDILLIEAPSGAGKSTLIGLLLKVLTPNEGKVLINGLDLKTISGNFRDHISYVGPEPFLFNATIKANLVYGSKLSNIHNDKVVWEALRVACAEDIVLKFENKLDEVLYEHTQLSTGQKQRLSLARAILRNTDVVILDESTANLDKDLELIIKNNISTILKNKICIIVAHKGHLKELATQVLKL